MLSALTGLVCEYLNPLRILYADTSACVRTGTEGLKDHGNSAVKSKYEGCSLCMVYELFIEFRWDLTDQTDGQFDDSLSL